MLQKCKAEEPVGEFSARKLSERYHLGDVEVNKMIILKLILRKHSVKAYSGFLSFELIYVTRTC